MYFLDPSAPYFRTESLNGEEVEEVGGGEEEQAD